MPETVIQLSPRSADAASFSAVVEAGDSFVHTVRKGEYVRIVDLEGNQATARRIRSASRATST